MKRIITGPLGGPSLATDFVNSQDYANAVGVSHDDGGGALRDGEIYLVNDSRLNEATFNTPLTEFAVGGWDRTDVAEELNSLFPALPVPRRFTYKQFLNAEAGISDVNEDLVSVNGDVPELEWKIQEATGVTQNRALGTVVNLDLVAPGWERQKTMILMRRIQRNILRRCYTLLSGIAVNTARTWDTTAGKDPDTDVRTSLAAGADISLVRPNTVVYGETAWTKRVLAHGAQNTASGFASKMLTPETLAQQLFVDTVKVSKIRYTANSTTRSQVVNNLVLSWYSEGPSEDDPSNIKRFVSPTRSGTPIRVYQWQLSDKRVLLVVEHFELVATTSSVGVRKETIS